MIKYSRVEFLFGLRAIRWSLSGWKMVNLSPRAHIRLQYKLALCA